MQEAIKLLMTFDAGESPIWRELLIPRHATAGDLGRWLAIAAGYKGTESWEILCREFKMRITEDRNGRLRLRPKEKKLKKPPVKPSSYTLVTCPCGLF